MGETLFATETMTRGAEISPCGRYRYTLTRRWSAAPLLTWIMLNPSTADAEKDDPTIRRCIGFARTWGCGGILVLNLFPLRATDPKELLRAKNPYGGRRPLVGMIEPGGPVMAAWGKPRWPLVLHRAIAVMHEFALARVSMCCLGTTKHGYPLHPLYVPGDAILTPFNGPKPTEAPQ